MYILCGRLLIELKQQVIEDLGDWIDDAFLRYGESKAPTAEVKCLQPVSPPRRISNNKRPSTSETENDDGITFVAKKDRRPATGSVDVENERTESPTINSPGLSGADLDKAISDAEEENGGESDGRGFVEGGKTAPGSRQGGQTISEGELMRRRRLLDSHIFE